MAGGTRSYEFAKRLVSWGHHVEMITSKRDINSKHTFKWEEEVIDGIKVHWLPVPYSNKMNFSQRIKSFLSFSLYSTLKVMQLDADLIFATSTPLTIAFPALIKAKTRNIPMVFEVRDLWPDVPIQLGILKNPVIIKLSRWLEKITYKNSNKIIALSPGIKEGIVSKGFNPDDIFVIPNASDLDVFNVTREECQKLREQNEWLKNNPLVIYTGTIGYVNGLEYLVRLAFHVFKNMPEARFLVIGDGREKDKVVKLAADLKILNKNIFFMDEIPKINVAYWLGAADITTSFLINNPILWDNSANKFFDSLAAGKPIAINYYGWQAELIKDHDIGIVLDPNNIENAARLMSEKLNDKKWLKNAGDRAKKLAQEVFNRDLLARKLECVLLDAVRTNANKH